MQLGHLLFREVTSYTGRNLYMTEILGNYHPGTNVYKQFGQRSCFAKLSQLQLQLSVWEHLLYFHYSLIRHEKRAQT